MGGRGGSEREGGGMEEDRRSEDVGGHMSVCGCWCAL